jgi:hypothetical protein
MNTVHNLAFLYDFINRNLNVNTLNQVVEESFNNQNPYKKITDPKYIEKMTPVCITQKEVDLNISCSICLEKFKLNEKVYKLPCGHYYHMKNEKDKDSCEGIVEWLNQNNTCPQCRHELPFTEVKIEDEIENIDIENDEQNRQINNEINGQINNEINGQINNEINGQINNQINRQVEMPMFTTQVLFLSELDRQGISYLNTSPEQELNNETNITTNNETNITTNNRTNITTNNETNNETNRRPRIIISRINTDLFQLDEDGFSNMEVEMAIQRSLEE